MNVRCERVYDYLKRQHRPDERVFLVDRVWPRGISKQKLDLDEWLKGLAPSTELRRWFAHEPARWPEFRSSYLLELERLPQERARLARLAGETTLTLLYGAKNREQNQAVVIQEWLESVGS